MPDSTALPSVTLRVLPVEEWDRLRDFGHFAKVGGLPNSEYTTILVLETVEYKKRIVGCWMAMNKVLLEGLHIEPEFRHHPTVARKLFFGMMHYLKGVGITQAMTITQDEDIAALAQKAGFELVPGSIHLLTLKEDK